MISFSEEKKEPLKTEKRETHDRKPEKDNFHIENMLPNQKETLAWATDHQKVTNNPGPAIIQNITIQNINMQAPNTASHK